MFQRMLLFVLAMTLAAPVMAEDASFKPIFNGKNLEGWKGTEKFWTVNGDGVLVAKSPDASAVPRNEFLVWDLGQVDDFELKLQFKIIKGNSGIQFRSQVADDGHVVGYQADIDDKNDYTGALYDEHGRGMLATRGANVHLNEDGTKGGVTDEADVKDATAAIKPVGQWNEYRIVAKGPYIQLYINGQLTANVWDKQEGGKRQSGILALQLHSGDAEVHFKDVQLRRLPMHHKKKVVFVAGRPSHGYGSHEHNAGCDLLARLLNEHTDDIFATVYHSGYPKDPTAFDNANSVVFFADGGGGHPVIPHLDEFQKVMDRGVGLVCIHYAVEVPPGDAGKKFVQWLGGYFEVHWSVNPHWDMTQPDIAKDHAIARGVGPIEIRDEWYFHMRFRPQMEGVTPILSAVAPDSTMQRGDGPHSGNPAVRESVSKKEPQTVGWATERKDGGRSFGFTGAHFHWNWGHNEFRKLVLNAIAWSAKADIPEDGIQDEGVTLEDLEANQDYDQPGNFNREAMEKKLQEWNGK